MNTDCIFCKIIARELHARIIDETDDLIVIQDIAPKAPIHYLVIPKIHMPDIVSAVNEHHANMFTPMMQMITKLSNNLSESKAFRLVFNNGKDAGQRVFHLHAHFLAGKTMRD